MLEGGGELNRLVIPPCGTACFTVNLTDLKLVIFTKNRAIFSVASLLAVEIHALIKASLQSKKKSSLETVYTYLILMNN